MAREGPSSRTAAIIAETVESETPNKRLRLDRRALKKRRQKETGEGKETVFKLQEEERDSKQPQQREERKKARKKQILRRLRDTKRDTY